MVTFPCMDRDEPTPEDLADIAFAGAEALSGRPPEINPAEALQIMRHRLEQLRQLPPDQFVSEQIRDTQQRIAEYEALNCGNN